MSVVSFIKKLSLLIALIFASCESIVCMQFNEKTVKKQQVIKILNRVNNIASTALCYMVFPSIVEGTAFNNETVPAYDSPIKNLLLYVFLGTIGGTVACCVAWSGVDRLSSYFYKKFLLNADQKSTKRSMNLIFKNNYLRLHSEISGKVRYANWNMDKWLFNAHQYASIATVVMCLQNKIPCELIREILHQIMLCDNYLIDNGYKGRYRSDFLKDNVKTLVHTDYFNNSYKPFNKAVQEVLWMKIAEDLCNSKNETVVCITDIDCLSSGGGGIRPA